MLGNTKYRLTLQQEVVFQRVMLVSDSLKSRLPADEKREWMIQEKAMHTLTRRVRSFTPLHAAV